MNAKVLVQLRQGDLIGVAVAVVRYGHRRVCRVTEVFLNGSVPDSVCDLVDEEMSGQEATMFAVGDDLENKGWTVGIHEEDDVYFVQKNKYVDGLDCVAVGKEWVRV